MLSLLTQINSTKNSFCCVLSILSVFCNFSPLRLNLTLPTFILYTIFIPKGQILSKKSINLKTKNYLHGQIFYHCTKSHFIDKILSIKYIILQRKKTKKYGIFISFRLKSGCFKRNFTLLASTADLAISGRKRKIKANFVNLLRSNIQKIFLNF